MKYNIITISRQCGSGGHTIGQRLANELGIELFDKTLLEEVAKRSGFAEQIIEDKGEHAPSPMWLTLARGIYNGYMAAIPETVPLEDQINAYQTEFIREIADKGACIIIGRGADYILRERNDCLHVYLYGDPDKRASVVMKRYGFDTKEAQNYVKKWDKERASHYKYVTDRIWGDVRNYTICLDSVTLGLDLTTEIILHSFRGE